MICGAAAVASVPEPKAFGKVLIFVEDTDILLSGDKWALAGNIALGDCNTLVSLMKSMLGHVCKKVQAEKKPKSFFFYILWEESCRLNKIFEELEDDSKSFRKLLFEETAVRNRVPLALELGEGYLIFWGTD